MTASVNAAAMALTRKLRAARGGGGLAACAVPSGCAPAASGSRNFTAGGSPGLFRLLMIISPAAAVSARSRSLDWCPLVPLTRSSRPLLVLEQWIGLEVMKGHVPDAPGAF